MFRSIVSVLFGRTAARASQFFVFLILARVLSTSDFGVYGVLMTTVLLSSTLGSIGLRQAVAYQIGRATLNHGSALGTILFIWPILSFFSVFISMLVAGAPIEGISFFATIVIYVFSVSGAMAVVLTQGLLLGLGRTSAFGLSDAVFPIGVLASTLLLYVSSYVRLESVLIGASISQLAAGLISIWLSGRGGWREIKIEISQVPNLVTRGFAFSLNIFLITLSSRLSLYLIDALLSKAESGLFFAGQRIGDMLVEAATAVGFVLFSDIIRSQDAAETTLRNIRIGAWILWLFSVGSIFIILLSSPLTVFMLGEKYEQSADILAITALAIGPTSATKIIYPTIAGQGHPTAGSPAILASICANLAICWFFIPIYGLEAASWALFASQAVLFVGYSIVVNRKFGIHWREILIPRAKFG